VVALYKEAVKSRGGSLKVRHRGGWRGAWWSVFLPVGQLCWNRIARGYELVARLVTANRALGECVALVGVKACKGTAGCVCWAFPARC
jgi:hypothetical protein